MTRSISLDICEATQASCIVIRVNGTSPMGSRRASMARNRTTLMWIVSL